LTRHAQLSACRNETQDLISRNTTAYSALLDDRQLVHILLDNDIKRPRDRLGSIDPVQTFDGLHHLDGWRRISALARYGAKLLRRQHSSDLSMVSDEEAPLSSVEHPLGDVGEERFRTHCDAIVRHDLPRIERRR
jgi:hypothetical protein